MESTGCRNKRKRTGRQNKEPAEGGVLVEAFPGRQCAICHSTSAQLGHAYGWRTLPASDSLSAVRTAMTTLFPNVATLQARSHLCAGSNCLYSTWRAVQRSSDPVTCKLPRVKPLLLLRPRDDCSCTP